MVSRASFIFLSIVLFSLQACAPAALSPASYKGEQIHFGQGGGYTGAITHYALLDDGRLFQKASMDSTFTFEVSWPESFVSQMFSNYHQLDLGKTSHYHPGDIYYFIEYHSPTKGIHRISWGQPGHTPADNIVAFYNLLYRSTKTKS